MIASLTHDDGTMRDVFPSCPPPPWSALGEALTLYYPPPRPPTRMRGHWRIRARARRVMLVQVTGRSKPELGAGGELETWGPQLVLPRILPWNSSAICVAPVVVAGLLGSCLPEEAMFLSSWMGWG